MKKAKLFLCVALALTLCACSNSQSNDDPYPEISKHSSSDNSLNKDSFQAETNSSLGSAPQVTSDTSSQSSEVDYYSYYDSITNRSTMFDSAEFDGGTLYMIDEDNCLKIVTPNSLEYCRKIDKVKDDKPEKCIVLGNYIFYQYQTKWNSTIGLKKYNSNNGEITVVVPSESLANTGISVPYDLEGARYVLSNDNKIYGTVLTWEKKPYIAENGVTKVKTIAHWNLVIINESHDGYKIVNEFSEEFDYSLRGVYDNIAFFSKSQVDKSKDGGRIWGEELGLYSYDIDNCAEEKVFDPYEMPSHVTQKSSEYSIIEINKELCFIYNNGNEIYLYMQTSGWKEIFSSPNQIKSDGVQLVNNKIYVLLCTEGYNYDYICYEVTSESNKYLGICEANNRTSPIIFFDFNMGKARFIDSYGNLKDFL